MYTEKCEKVHGREGLAMVAIIGSNHAVIKRTQDRIRAQTKIRKYIGTQQRNMFYYMYN